LWLNKFFGGIVLAPNKALCETCSLNETNPKKLSIEKINRISLVEADPENAFLRKGLFVWDR